MKEIYRNALNELLEGNLTFCLIHDRDLSRSGKDLDIVVQNIDHFEKVLLKYNYTKLTNFHWVRYDHFYQDWVIIDATEKFNFLRHNIEGVKKQVINNSVFCIDNKFKKLDPVDLAVYTLIKALCSRGYFPSKYINIINTGLLFESIKKQKYSAYSFFSDNVLNELNKLSLNFEPENWNKKFAFFIKSFNGYIILKKRNFLTKRIYKRLLAKSRMIAFIGPDGSGKSTLIEIFSKLPLVKVKYMGPGQNDKDISYLLRSFRDTLYLSREKTLKSSLYGKTIRLLYLLVLYADLLERYFKKLYTSRSKKLVLFDRFAFDVYVRNPDFIRRFLFLNLFPSPKNIIYLKGRPDKIHMRKPELSINEIRNTFNIYDKELHRIAKVNVVDSTENDVNESVKIILKIFSELSLLPI